MSIADQDLPSPTAVPHLFASHMLRTSSASASIQVRDIAAVIGEITMRSQILGASFLTVTVIDPDWEFQISGFCDVSDEGLLDDVEVNFPEGSSKWWRLCAISGTGDRTSANVTLTFEDRIIAYLRDHWGPLTVSPNTTTRAQFIKKMVDEVKANGGIRFVCPSINAVQTVASSSTDTSLGQATISTAIDQQNATTSANKSHGLGHGAAVSVKGQALNRNQIAEVTTLLQVAGSLNAGPIATQALIFAAIAESGIGRDPGSYKPNREGYYGVLQGSSSTWPDPHDTAGMARAFLQGGKGFQAGGAIALARGTSSSGNVGGVNVNSVLLGGGPISDPIEIAVRVEAPSNWPANAYAVEAGYSNFLPEAKAIIAAGGGAAFSSAPGSDVSQLTRGTVDNPDEDSWDCITRLAQQVQWFAFSNGDYLYYMDGYDLIAQKPAAYVKLISSIDGQPTNGLRWQVTDAVTGQSTLDAVVSPSPYYTFDDTTYIYKSTHTVRGKIQRKSRAAKPSTPSEIQINIICPVDWAHAGDVFVFQDCGPMNGRWVVTDATRNVLGDLFTQFTLEPPIAPTPEPQASDDAADLGTNGASSASVGGYVNPFSAIKNLKGLRIDMGVDYTGTGDVYAIGNATIFQTAGPGWPGNTFIGYKLLDGAYAGKFIYIAEDITPSVKVGQTVRAGQKIGTMGSPSIEIGWASGSGDQTLAASLSQQHPTGDPGAWSSAAGSSFNNFLVSLGCIPGIMQSGGPHGKMPPGFPTA